jgi:sugar phosphate isomerase/epimerase
MSLRIGSLRIGLAAYSFPWRCGFAGRGTDRVCSTPFAVEDLMALAASYGLSAIEFPLDMVSNREPATLAALRARAAALGLAIVCDSGVIDVATLEASIPMAAALGARTLRVMLSSTLEGARASIPGGWEAHLEEMIARLKELRPLAEYHGVCLAPENHQDATSADLIRICDEVGGDAIGVTLDAVNPLAVGEEPIAFARALGSRIVDVHLKDYRVYATPSGYRLVRSALGEGVLDLGQLFNVLQEVAPQATCNIELAAINARHIRLLEDDWWAGFPPRDVREVIPALRLALRNVRPGDEEWRTPWERGMDRDALGAYEEQQVASSVECLRQLAARRQSQP